jgi:hypothetical protein
MNRTVGATTISTRLWTNTVDSQARSQRHGLAKPKAGPTVSPVDIHSDAAYRAANMTLSPNKYTPWGKLCGLRWEMQADLGIDCGRYVVLPSCPPSFAGLCAGAGETVFHLELRIRQLSPASTQPTTTYLYIFVLQDRQVIDTGAPGDNPTPGPRVVAPGRQPSERGPDLSAAGGHRRGWQEQMISPAHSRPEHFTAGVVVPCARHFVVRLTKQTISSRPSPFSWINRQARRYRGRWRANRVMSARRAPSVSIIGSGCAAVLSSTRYVRDCLPGLGTT